MKNIPLIIIAILFNLKLFGQITLSESEVEILTEICNQYNVPLKESTLGGLKESVPERFSGFVKQLIISKDNPKEILDYEILKRPAHEELVFWYIVREFHYNNTEPDSLQKSQREIIDWILQDTIDERWLLDNYYYRISGRLKSLFNKANLSKHNFEIDELGFKNDTEKAIFFFFVINSCGQRLSIMRKIGSGNQKSVVKRMPKINSSDYYNYQGFDYPDFDWVGYKKLESYNERHLGVYFSILISHVEYLFEEKMAKEAHVVYDNSILSNPKLFKYSNNSERLQKMYNMMKR